MLPPDSVTNIRAVLDQDAHALPVWAVRALRLMLDEREHLIAGLIGETATEEMAKVRRRIACAHHLLVGWQLELERPQPAGDRDPYVVGYRRGLRGCIHDLRTVLTMEPRC